jgi:hypothetical protein
LLSLERASSSLAICIIANVAELADALGLGPSVVKDVRVRVSPFALQEIAKQVLLQKVKRREGEK